MSLGTISEPIPVAIENKKWRAQSALHSGESVLPKASRVDSC